MSDTVTRLPNVCAKIRAGKTIRVGYFGGSVTNGYGATDQNETSWRGLSLKWLNDTFGARYGCSFYEGKHAGLGGTGTNLNVYRADRALGLSGGEPVDLLFIEFAINDSYEALSYDGSAYYLESIVRKVRTMAPACDTVVCLVTDIGKRDMSFANANAHADVAAFYGIPVFPFGKYLWEYMEQAGGGRVPKSVDDPLWQSCFRDGCHPNDGGYRKYFEFLRDHFLTENLGERQIAKAQSVTYALPSSLFSEKLTEAPFAGAAPRLDAYDIVAGSAKNASLAYGFSGEDTLTALHGGASLAVTFRSCSAGIYYEGNPDNGALLYSVDGGDCKTLDLYAKQPVSNRHFMFYDHLPYGEHTVRLIFRATAGGAVFRLRAFVLDGDKEHFGAVLSDAPNKAPLPDILPL